MVTVHTVTAPRSDADRVGRFATAAAGTMVLGTYGLPLALPLVALWVFYAFTTPTHRAFALLALGLAVGYVGRQALPDAGWNA